MFVITASHEEILRRAGAYVGTDPLEPALGLMRDGVVRFHGPEHHYLTAACLCAAWCNALGEDKREHLERHYLTAACLCAAWCNALGEDKREHLERLLSRCARIPPAVCGYYGVCGDSMAAGACASELLGANYLSGESWQRVNELTARTQAAIAASCKRGPRCCKRTTFAAIIAASGWIRGTLGIDIAVREGFRCPFHSENKQCLGRGCGFFPEGPEVENG